MQSDEPQQVEVGHEVLMPHPWAFCCHSLGGEGLFFQAPPLGWVQTTGQEPAGEAVPEAAANIECVTRKPAALLLPSAVARQALTLQL